MADKLEGRYTLCDKPVTDNVSYIEDADAFNYKNNFYLLTTDNYGDNTRVYGDIILWQSKTGMDFKLANAKTAFSNMFDYWGTEEQHKKLLAT